MSFSQRRHDTTASTVSMTASRTNKTSSRCGSSTSRTGGEAIVLRLPIRTVNALNVREHWSVRSKRSKQERMLARYTAAKLPIGQPRPALPCVVTLTREAPRQMDGDGLQASFKAIRDGVADAFQVTDNDRRIAWRYDQRKSKTYGVVIEIRSAA